MPSGDGMPTARGERSLAREWIHAIDAAREGDYARVLEILEGGETLALALDATRGALPTLKEMQRAGAAKGGRAVRDKYGPEYMGSMGARGARARWGRGSA